MPGGRFLITTKSGTNAYHGTLFRIFCATAPSMARNFFSPGAVSRVSRRNQFGASGGGKI